MDFSQIRQSPVRALEDFKVNCKHYNTILSDIRMPRRNGYEFVKKVKEIDKQAKIVVMSGLRLMMLEVSRLCLSLIHI